MVHQVAVLSWIYGLASPYGRHDIDFGTPMAAGAPALAWGCLAGWLGTRVRCESQGALVAAALVYLVVVASVLPLVSWAVHGLPPSHALEQLTLVLFLSVFGLVMGVGALFMLHDLAALLPLIVRGLLGVGPLLLLVVFWTSASLRRTRVAPSPS
jgi:hypothetical protein